MTSITKKMWKTDTRGPNMGSQIGPYPKETSEEIIRKTAKARSALGYVRTSTGTWYIKHIGGNIADVIENLTQNETRGYCKKSKFILLGHM